MRRLLHHGSVENQRGMILLYVLVMTQVLAVITVGIMLILTAVPGDLPAAQGVKTYAVAEGGANYALAKLQEAGAPTYAGESVIIVDGATTIGTATVTVSCLEGGALPCTGTYASYRRVVSVGTLPVSGPQRTVTLTLQGAGTGSGTGACASESLTLGPSSTLYGDVASNGSITLNGTGGTVSRVRADPAPPYSNDGSFTGSARATGAVTCASGSCAPHVQGTTTPNIGTPVCAMSSLPAFAPGGSNLTVASGTTFNWNPATSYNSITVNAGTSGGGFGIGTACATFTTLNLQAGAAGTTTVFNARSILMNSCTRLMVSGAGNVELRLAEASSEALEGGSWSRIGVLPIDLPGVPAPVPAGRLKIVTPSTSRGASAAALDFDGMGLVSAILMAPNGGITYEAISNPNGRMYGTLQARQIILGNGLTHTYDSSVAQTMGWAATSFGTLRGWKDQ